jgi:decaprenylphospho-beta-D-erythro-pentofuranosid-2-ulose 2-reductase
MIDATGMPETAVVLGGSSAIGRAVLVALARRRLRSVLLVGRDEGRLAGARKDLAAAGVRRVETVMADLTDLGGLEELAGQTFDLLGGIDLLLVAAGVLGHAELDRLDAEEVGTQLTTNLVGPAAAMTAYARRLAEQGHGRVVVLSSVAGVRVRRANFVYGAAKAGLDGFAQGLGDVLAGSGVTVTVVRPGFVRTPMTEGLPEAPFATDAGTVAEAVVRGLERGARVVWVPGELRYVFAGLRLLPSALWRRLPG